jgi:hypothetical protein
MIKSVEENLGAIIRPPAKTPCEWRARHDRRIAPVIRDHEHCYPASNMRLQQVDQLIDSAFETR